MGLCQSTNGTTGATSQSGNSEEHLHEKVKRLKKMRELVFEEKPDLDFKPEETPAMEKDAETRTLIKTAVKKNPKMDWIKDSEADYIARYATRRAISAGEAVITQGEEGHEFFVIGIGKFSVIDETTQNTVVTLPTPNGGGTSFGELALLVNAPRSHTIKADIDGEVWVVERKIFRCATANAHAKSRNDDMKLLSRVDMLQRLSPSVLGQIIQASSHQIYEPGNVIITKGEKGKTLFIIAEGQCEVTGFDVQPGGPSSATKKAGDYFGEHAIRDGNNIRDATVTATTRCDLFYVTYDEVNKAVGSLEALITEQENSEKLSNVKILEGLSNEERRAAARKFKTVFIKSGSTIIEENTVGKCFYIISKGTVNVSSNQSGDLTELKNGDHFGEMALLSSKKTSATITAITDVELLMLSDSDFSDVVDGQIENGLLKTAKVRQEERRAKVEKNIPYEKLKFVAVLGAGTFGRVKQVLYNDEVYALKILHKAEIVRHKQQDNVLNEKNVMMMCHHPLILRLHKTYKDRYRVFMLIEFCRGGELFTRIHDQNSARRDGLDEKAARFYGFGVALALSYLRQHHIAYRDLKPENMLIDEKGYPKLIDFGFAKVLTGQTWTLCGTPEYMAPEIILGRGYDFAVDWWAFGILLYEMLAGCSPFHDPNGVDQRIVCQNIVQGKLKFVKAKSIFKPESKTLITKLLQREKSNRPGTGAKGGSEVTDFPWFASLDVGTYLNKQVKNVPWLPPKDPLDTSNFYSCDVDDAYDKNFQDKSNWDKDF